MSEISDNDPLWFLKHNPRAYGEVKDWLEAKRKSPFYFNLDGTGTFQQWNECLAELLDDLENDIKFATKGAITT